MNTSFEVDHKTRGSGGKRLWKNTTFFLQHPVANLLDVFWRMKMRQPFQFSRNRGISNILIVRPNGLWIQASSRKMVFMTADGRHSLTINSYIYSIPGNARCASQAFKHRLSLSILLFLFFLTLKILSSRTESEPKANWIYKLNNARIYRCSAK